MLYSNRGDYEAAEEGDSLLVETNMAEGSCPATGSERVITFAGVSPEFVLRVCEALLARTKPTDTELILLGGVHLRLYVETHWAGFERYMLIGQSWTCGFNLKPPEDEIEALPANAIDEGNVFKAFSSELEMFTPHLTGERNFLRDMMILMMTASEWTDESEPMIW